MRPALLIAILIFAAVLGLLPREAAAVDRNIAGSAQLDYFLVPTQGTNLNGGDPPGTYGFDGFTLEATEKLAVDVSDHLSANVKLCFGCHGFELDMAYMDYRVVDEFNVRVGRFSPSFGSFNVRHDVANHKLSDKPLPYDMGRMLRLRTWNMGVLPSPFPDNGIELDGTHWFGGSTQLDYAVYAIEGFKADTTHPLDIDFRLSHLPYYTDNNGHPTIGGRLALTQKLAALSDMTAGASGMYGTYDPNNRLDYAILGGDLSFRFHRTNLRFEYLVRRTKMDTTSPTLLALPVDKSGSEYFTKHGAYAELEQPLSPSVDLLVRVDGMYRIGNFEADAEDPLPLHRKSSVARYTLGAMYAFEQGFRVKLSTELWQFSDKNDEARSVALGLHTAFVGTY